MLFLLSPSKALDYQAPVPAAVRRKATEPLFVDLSLIHIFGHQGDVLALGRAAARHGDPLRQVAIPAARHGQHGELRACGSVSYTHLDVYKRQAWYCPVWFR